MAHAPEIRRRHVGAAILVAIATAAIGCGGKDGPAITGGQLRDCLAEQGFVTLPERAGAGLSNLTTDFSAAIPGGTVLDVAIEKTPARAAAAAANARSSLQAVGIKEADAAVFQSQNVVLLFEDAPSAAESKAAMECL